MSETEGETVTQTCSSCGAKFTVKKEYAFPESWVAKGLCFCCLKCADDHNEKNGHVCGRDPCGDFDDEVET